MDEEKSLYGSETAPREGSSNRIGKAREQPATGVRLPFALYTPEKPRRARENQRGAGYLATCPTPCVRRRRRRVEREGGGQSPLHR